MSQEYDILKEAYNSIKKKVPYEPKIAVTLGSGLGDFVDKIKADATINFNEIANFPKTTNENHKGRLIFAKINGVETLIMQGRIHFYEGYSAVEAVRPVRLAKLLGVDKLLVTNAAGGVNKNFKPGDLMIIKNHISLFAPNPLIGENLSEFGVRFPDMTNVYDKDMIKEIKKVATKYKIKMKEGVYAQLKGPSYETATEITLLSKLGVDAVGMSTVIEVIAARHAGIKTAGISVITNLGTGLSKKVLSDDDVRETAKKVSSKMEKIIKNVIPKL